MQTEQSLAEVVEIGNQLKQLSTAELSEKLRQIKVDNEFAEMLIEEAIKRLEELRNDSKN